jgi:hypothetical protein
LELSSLDIIGPNSVFVSQSGTYPKRFTDFRPEDTTDKDQKAADIVRYALTTECDVPVTSESIQMWRLLGSLGSHDLSAMREALGTPTAVLGASLGSPFWRLTSTLSTLYLQTADPCQRSLPISRVLRQLRIGHRQYPSI